jgi:RNA polymerase sigma-32 factor
VVGQPERGAVDQHRLVGPGRGQGGGEVQRRLDRGPAAAPVALVPGDAVAHLVVPGLGRGDVAAGAARGGDRPSAKADFPDRAPPTTRVRGGSDPVTEQLPRRRKRAPRADPEVVMALDGYTDLNVSRQAMKAELLDAETEAQLARAWRDRRDERALHRLITAYMRLAISMAARFRRYGAPMNDLIQEAIAGPDEGRRQVRPRPGRAVLDLCGLVDQGGRSRTMSCATGRWCAPGRPPARRRCSSTCAGCRPSWNARPPERGEPLDQTSCASMVAAEAGRAGGGCRDDGGPAFGVGLFAERDAGPDEDGREWIDALEDEACRPPRRWRSRMTRTSCGLAGQGAAGLNPRERYIVAERKLKDEGRTLESLGEELGLSKERIRQLEAAAFAKMRRSLASPASWSATFA